MFWLRFGFFILLMTRIFTVAFRLRQRFAGETLTDRGDAYVYSVFRAKGKVTGARLGFEVADQARFIMRREGRYDRIAKWVGIAREWQTDDERFDRAIFIIADDERLLGACSQSAELRAAMEDLLAQPLVRSVHCAFGTFWVECRGRDISERDESDAGIALALARTLHHKLAAARTVLADLHLSPWRHERDPAFTYEQVLVGVATMLGLVGLVAFFVQMPTRLPHPLTDHAITQHAWLAAGAATLLLLVMLALFLGRTSRTHLVLLELLLVGMPGAWLAGSVWYEQQNERLDRSPALDYVTTIADKYVSHGRRSTSYFIRVPRWPVADADPELRVSRDVYGQLQAGQCAHFEIHAGALGDPWLADITPADHC